MKSRADWWEVPTPEDFAEILEQGRIAIEEAKRVIAELDGTSSTSSPGGEQFDWSEYLADPDVSPDQSSPKVLVTLFLDRCNEELNFRILQKHIWKAAGHGHARQFQYWKSSNPKATVADDINFRRILSLSSGAFETLLRSKAII